MKHANKPYFQYVKQAPAEKAKLLKMVLPKSPVDRINTYPTDRMPFE